MRVNAKLAIAVATLAGTMLARADINLPFSPPPSPMSRTVEVAEGGRIDIPLTVTGAPAGRTLDFVIRIPPTKGRLDPVRNAIAGDSAAVTYTHNPALGGGRDQFSFAVQRNPGGTSSSATIDIRIVENPPRLQVLPLLLDFGPVPLEAPPPRAQFTLVNQGGGTAAGRVILQPPFRIEGDESYRLARGQRKTFAVLFQPAWGSLFEGEARFGASFDQTLRLSGTGVAPEAAPTPAGRPAAAASPTVPGRLPAEAPPAGEVAPTPASGGPSGPAVTEPASPEEPVPGGDEVGLPNYPGGAVPLRDFLLQATERGLVTASWLEPDKAAGAGLSYRLEQRELYFDSARNLRAQWKIVPLPAAPALRGERRSVELTRLPRGTMSTLRATAWAGDGTLRGYSAFASVELPPEQTRWLLWGALAAGLGLGFALWKARRPEPEP